MTYKDGDFYEVIHKYRDSINQVKEMDLESINLQMAIDLK